MRCHNCGYENIDNNYYCNRCGAALKIQQTPFTKQLDKISMSSLVMAVIVYVATLITLMIIQPYSGISLNPAVITIELLLPPILSSIVYCKLEKIHSILPKSITLLAIVNTTILVILEILSGGIPLISIIGEYLIIIMGSFIGNVLYEKL